MLDLSAAFSVWGLYARGRVSRLTRKGQGQGQCKPQIQCSFFSETPKGVLFLLGARPSSHVRSHVPSTEYTITVDVLVATTRIGYDRLKYSSARNKQNGASATPRKVLLRLQVRRCAAQLQACVLVLTSTLLAACSSQPVTAVYRSKG